jgi:ABC-2 type transport system ATP-binding protein
MPQISVKNLSKTFSVSLRKTGVWGSLRGLVSREIRTVRALDGVNFTIDQGELVGYIGPNGAGKSTTVKVMAGILVPDSGECTISGRTPWKERIKHVSRIGVVFGQRSQLWWDLPVVESFDLLREIYCIPADEERRTREELVELLGLSPFLDVPVRQLSLGWRMRCELAASLLHQPDILFLDEPTIGLDAVSKLAVREFLRRLNVSRKMTVILTTHDMDDIEALCSRTIVIGAGKIMFDGTIELLRRRIRNERRLTIDLERDDIPFSDPDAVLEERIGSRLRLSFNADLVQPGDLVKRIMNGYPVRDIFIESPEIEEVVAQLYADPTGFSGEPV